MEFHGDLLMGGVSIRGIDGRFDDDADGHQTGTFEVESHNRSLFDLDRTFLLLLDNGKSIKLKVGALEDNAHGRLVVQFGSIS